MPNISDLQKKRNLVLEIESQMYKDKTISTTKALDAFDRECLLDESIIGSCNPKLNNTHRFSPKVTKMLNDLIESIFSTRFSDNRQNSNRLSSLKQYVNDALSSDVFNLPEIASSKSETIEQQIDESKRSSQDAKDRLKSIQDSDDPELKIGLLYNLFVFKTQDKISVTSEQSGLSIETIVQSKLQEVEGYFGTLSKCNGNGKYIYTDFLSEHFGISKNAAVALKNKLIEKGILTDMGTVSQKAYEIIAVNPLPEKKETIYTQ